MKPDEVELLLRVSTKPLGHVWEAVDELGMNHKRAVYIFEKWCVKDWYEYGVSVAFGWLTDAGKAEATRLRATSKSREER